VSPTRKESRLLQKQHKPSYNKAILVNLTSGKKQEFDMVRRFAFSRDAGGWLALHKYPSPAQGASPERWSGTDLNLHEIATSTGHNMGNASDFAFNKKGQWLALLIDALGKSGNGVQLRNLATASTTVLDSGKAVYQGLAWTEKGDAFAVLKGVEDKDYPQPLYTVLGFGPLGK